MEFYAFMTRERERQREEMTGSQDLHRDLRTIRTIHFQNLLLSQIIFNQLLTQLVFTGKGRVGERRKGARSRRWQAMGKGMRKSARTRRGMRKEFLFFFLVLG